MISDNIYIDDIVKQVLFCKQNALCNQLTAEVSKIDPITNYDEFKNYVIKEILGRVRKRNRAVLYSVKCGEEGAWYGHRDSLAEYIHYRNGDERFLLPNIWHGAEFVGYEDYNAKFPHYFQKCPVFVAMSDFCIDQIRALRPWLQVYPVGPYIYYAKGYYDESRILLEREKNGKTALYFPQHSTETVDVSFKMNQAKANIDYLTQEYDTVLVSVYWADVDNPAHDYYLKKGAKLVSSGVRSDSNFIRRQRSLFELADDVYGNAIGTNLGYALAMGKPYYFFQDEVKIHESSTFRQYMNSYEYREKEIKENWNGSSSKEKERIYDRFWGGKRFIRSKQEISNIFSVQKTIRQMTHGNVAKIDAIIKAVVIQNEQFDFNDMEIQLIRNSVALQS